MRSLHAVRDLGGHEVVGVAARHGAPPVLDELGDLPVMHSRLPRPALYEAWHRFRRPGLPSGVGDVDVVHATGGVMPPAVPGTLVATVHDLVFLDQPETLTPRGVRFMSDGFAIARDEAARVVVPSEATAEACRARGIDDERLRVVHWGTHVTAVTDAERARVRAAHALPDRFVLFVGTIEPRKNLARLVAAHAAATPDLPLVLVGPDGWGETGIDPAGSVRSLGYVSAVDLPVLYDLADALAYPSLLEGFGLPVLEAMAQGTATITSATTATAEVAGDVGLLVDPLDTDSIAEALVSVRDDADRWAADGDRASDRAALFTWEATATALAAVYDEVAA